MIKTDGLISAVAVIIQSCTSLFGCCYNQSLSQCEIAGVPSALCAWMSLGACLLVRVPSASSRSAGETRVQWGECSLMLFPREHRQLLPQGGKENIHWLCKMWVSVVLWLVFHDLFSFHLVLSNSIRKPLYSKCLACLCCLDCLATGRDVTSVSKSKVI